MMDVTTKEEVTKLEENASISQDKFIVPSDITFTEIKMPGE